jgi:U5 small nuclear ribonucleoprotein component
MEISEDDEDPGNQIVLHEDKQYYPEAEQIFGKNVSALVEEEDHQPITTPIIEAPKTKFN